jgi:uncharacterized protein
MPTIDAQNTKSTKEEQHSTNSNNTGDEFQKTVSENSKIIVILTHIAGIFVGPLLPLAIYLLVSDPLVKEEAKEALNFQLNIWIAAAVLGLVMAVSLALFFLVIPLLVAFVAGIGLLVLVVAQVVLPILAVISTNEGKVYRYPYIYRIIK